VSRLKTLAALALRALFLVAALICAGIALLAQGGRFSGRLDSLTHLAPLWLTAGVVSALIASALTPERRRALPLGAGLVTLVSALLLITPEFLRPQPPTAPPAEASLKVLQFNLWEGNRDPAATLGWILAQNADVVVVEETRGKARPILKGLMAVYPYRITCTGDGPCSTAILSRRRPIDSSGLQIRDRPGRIPIAGAWARFPDPSGPFTVAAIHLTWPMLPPGLQKAQLASLNASLDGLPKDRMILAGDFNSTPWSFTLRAMDRRVGLTRRTRALMTFPAARPLLFGLTSPLPVLPIDQVYAGPGWRTVSVSRGPKLGSDHYPVLVELAPVRRP
jgi:endonuclease/exonuclease/phosphatase (EEP) superfamily protein YafD